jgi:hypothetical protein
MLPSQAEIARKWAAEYHYPLSHADDFPQVAQYLAVTGGQAFAKEEFAKTMRRAGQPPLTVEDEPHHVLAELPLAVYITANFDTFMTDALRLKAKDPIREPLRWSESLGDKSSALDRGDEPSVVRPLVFHLFGVLETPESLVLTEDDYLDYLTNITSNPDTIPYQVQRILAGTQLLFIGFDTLDRGFRVLLKSLDPFIKSSRMRSSFVVQMESADGVMSPEVQRYLERYFYQVEPRTYWGTPQEFTRELGERWKEYSRGG